MSELAERVGGELTTNGAVTISGAAPIETAGQHEISFVANPSYRKYISTTRAGALVLDRETPDGGVPALRHPNPYLTFARIVDLLNPDDSRDTPGIHPTAVIEKEASVSPEASIGPFCHVCSGSMIGPCTTLRSSVYVGPDSHIGENCLIYPGVRILSETVIGKNVILHAGVVVGSDGFGFTATESGLKKIKQIGWVEIGDDVEIGANTTIDRGALGPTRIGKGTKIDNLVQIAHNVEIGEHCIIVAQVGISGSTTLGKGVVLAGQVGVVGHLELGDGVQVGAQSGVNKSIPPGRVYFGSPAREAAESMRMSAALRQLPDLIKRVRKLESDKKS